MPQMNLAVSDQIDCWTAELLERGWCVIPGLLPTETVRALDADLAADFVETGGGMGHGFRLGWQRRRTVL